MLFLAVNALLIDLDTLVKEQKDIARYYTEAIRNVYGVYIEDLDAASLDGTTQEILYGILARQGMGKEEVDRKMEVFINESPYVYYNVAGHDSMSLSDGARDALNSFSKSREVVFGIATPVLQETAANMMERAGIDPSIFKFREFGGYKKDGTEILANAAEAARRAGADGEPIFVSGSPHMLKCAKVPGMKTIAVVGGSPERYPGSIADEKIKSLKDLRKAVAKVSR